ncbi:MAG: hypothetical protein Q8L77_03995 [Nitrospirota bacterium]|nr:hypothetical protein [Nitrospirota bacterium]
MAHATTSAPAEVIIEVSVQPWTIFSRNKSVGVSLIPIVLKTPDPAPALAA